MSNTQKLTAFEALYGFAAWLTTRAETITASSKHDAAPWAKAVDDFCQANDLNSPRDKSYEDVVFPSSEESRPKSD